MTEEPEQTTDDGRIVHCDKCGKPLRRFDAVYSVAHDEEKALGRHWDCHQKMQKEFTSSMERVKVLSEESKFLLDKIERGFRK